MPEIEPAIRDSPFFDIVEGMRCTELFVKDSTDLVLFTSAARQLL
jgi:hypothetical protein